MCVYHRERNKFVLNYYFFYITENKQRETTFFPIVVFAEHITYSMAEFRMRHHNLKSLNYRNKCFEKSNYTRFLTLF